MEINIIGGATPCVKYIPTLSPPTRLVKGNNIRIHLTNSPTTVQYNMAEIVRRAIDKHLKEDKHDTNG